MGCSIVNQPAIGVPPFDGTTHIKPVGISPQTFPGAVRPGAETILVWLRRVAPGANRLGGSRAELGCNGYVTKHGNIDRI